SDYPEDLNPLFLPSGKELACWTYFAGRVTLCEIPPGRRRDVWRAHQDRIEGLAASPDRRFLASTGSEGARLWAVAEQKEVARLVGHRGAAYAAAFSPDGRILATVGIDDLTLRVWELPPGCETRR